MAAARVIDKIIAICNTCDEKASVSSLAMRMAWISHGLAK